jgi:hypothetical protein
MTRLPLRAMGVLSAIAAIIASLLAPPSTAVAATNLDAAVSAFSLGSYTLNELPGSGDITNALKKAVSTPGTKDQANVVHLPAGSVTVSAIVRPANNVYIVAEPGTTINWRGSDPYLLRFSNVTGGVSGGTWDGAGRSSTTVIGMGGSTVQLADLTVTHAGKYGIGAYQESTTHQRSSLTLRNVTTKANKVDGVHLEGSDLYASGLRSTSNRRNGVQLSSGSVGTITGSVLDLNGQAVKGSTTGKTGHGLGVASATVTVSGTSISRNKVCGVSLTGAAIASISGKSQLNQNGRHGLGTVPGVTATISDSTANGNGYNGVLASGKGTNVALQRVAIDSAKRSGLSVPSGGAATIEGSTITRARKYDISVSANGSLTLLGGNTISASRSHGITVSGKGSITVSGANNVVTGSRGDGLRITGSGTKGRIEASTSFASNRNSGIVVVSKAKLWMVRCAFSGNRKTVEKRSGGKLYSLV